MHGWLLEHAAVYLARLAVESTDREGAVDKHWIGLILFYYLPKFGQFQRLKPDVAGADAPEIRLKIQLIIHVL